MRCKLVCKLWCKLISESSFADYYAKNSGFTHLLLPLNLHFCALNTQTLFLLEIAKNGECIRREIGLKLPVRVVKTSSEFVVGSCNGLIISAIRRQNWAADLVYLSHLLTGGSIELPEYEAGRKEESFVYYRIGFSPSLDKFKVVRFAYKNWEDSKIDTFAILTVGVDDGWRQLKCQSNGWWYSADWICLNGTFHWIVERNGSFRIATFDLAEEKFGLIIGSPGLELNSKSMKLMSLNSRVALVDLSIPFQFTLWTMKDYAFAKSWKKDVVLMSWFPPEVDVTELFPVEKLPNGDLLFGDSVFFFSVDVKRKKCSNIEEFCYPKVGPRINSIMTYRPRFRSFGEALMEGQWSTVNFESKCLELLFHQEASCVYNVRLPRLKRRHEA